MTEVCKTCRKPKAPYVCGLCSEHTCKACTQFMSEDFSALRKGVPDFLKHNSYCINCFDDQVAAPLSDYTGKMEKARDIIIYSKEQSKLTRFLKRKTEPYVVEGCEDEEEAVMKMSFYAVEDGFNCLIDLQYNSKKLIVGSHKKTLVGATAMGITIDPNEIRGHMDSP